MVHVDTPDRAANIEARFVNRRDTSPSGSAFDSLNQAKDWLVQLFDAYHPRNATKTDVVSIQRNEWELTVVDDTIAQYQYMADSEHFPPGATALDPVFAVEDLNYRWNRARTVRA